MRINNDIVTSIFTVFENFLPNATIDVYLYGSRTNDKAKGGDIDLLWVVAIGEVENLNINKYKILTKLTKLIGEQKIDLTITANENIKLDPFLSNIIQNAVKLVAPSSLCQ